MDFPAQIDGLARARLPARPLHLAIGMFDGVHLGHRQVIAAAVQSARAEQGLCGVLTFWPHPSALFRPENPTRLILPAQTKAGLLLAQGVDVVITEAFTPELAAVSAAAFLPWLKERLPGLAAIYVGSNFRYGQRRRGDTATLEAAGRECGIRISSIPPVTLDAHVVSSTRIRSHLEAGEITAANALLGYPYFSSGVVTPGKQLGRTLGFPTLNVPWAPELRPRLGVYAVRLSGEKAPGTLPGVANYGLRPTVEQAVAPRLEVHVLGPCPFGAGDVVRVEWLAFLRPERKFADVAALRAQIAEDRRAAEAYFSH